MKSLLLVFIVLMLCTFSVKAQQTPSKDIVDTTIEARSFSVFTKALTLAGLIDTLRGEGPFTVLAPTDDAFSKLSSVELDSLLTNVEALRKLLFYHIIPGHVTPDKMILLEAATTAEGSEVSIEIDGSIMRINKQNVLTVLTASNGFVYIIDSVLHIPAQ